MFKITLKPGQTLIELLIAIGLAAVLLPALVSGIAAARQGKPQQTQRLAAVGLLKEAEEAVRAARNNDWANVQTSGTYHPEVSGNTWILQPSAETTTTGYGRSITISDVLRDDGGLISATGTHPDPSTKKVVTNVSWSTPFATSVSATEYLTRFQNNTVFTGSGTIQPPAGGFGNWCKPIGPSITNINIPHQAAATSIEAFETTDGTGNRIFMGTGASADSPAYTNVKIIGNNPPNATVLGSYNGSPNVKANGLAGDSHYAFLGTDNRGVQILDLTTTPPYQKIGSFNVGGGEKVNDVYVVGNTGYAVTTNKFYIFSISADRKTTAQIGSLALANGVKVVVDSSNQYAYVPNPDTNGELKIIDVHTHPTTLSQSDVKNVNVDGGVGRDVFINAGANRAYLATAASSSKPEFFIINITDKANPSVFANGTYDTNGMDPQGVVVVLGEKAIIAGTGGHEYQVFSVADDTVSFCPNHSENNDFLDIDSGIYAISSIFQSDSHAYSYITTGDKGAELKIIEGGGGGGGVGNGTFESTTFDAGHDVAFNYFSTPITDSNLSYEISIKHGASESCNTVTFTDSFVPFTPPVSLPLSTIGSGYVNPGQCLRYRVINSGISAASYTVTINYSP